MFPTKISKGNGIYLNMNFMGFPSYCLEDLMTIMVDQKIQSVSGILLDNLGELAKMSSSNLNPCTLQLLSNRYWYYACWHAGQLVQRSSTPVCSGLQYLPDCTPVLVNCLSPPPQFFTRCF